jgi:hypothetical protein
MSLPETLTSARAKLADGWSEPFTFDTEGRFACWDDEGAATFCVVDALASCSDTGEELADAFTLLESIALPGRAGLDRAARGCEAGVVDAEAVVAAARAPGAGNDLQSWLEHPNRKAAHVLAVFDVAVLRARRLEG